MEYIPGGALRELLTKEKQLPLNRTLDLALELTDALGRAHHLGIIHRDLKPENVLIAHDGTPRLTDFGLARLSRENTRLTQTGAIIGSPVYMSPEAARGEELDARSDIWSFGILLFECLAGRLPFDGEQITSILLKILKDPLPDIKKYRPDIPDALESLLNRMLVKDRQGRIASIRQVAAELEAIRDGRVLTPPTTLALAAPTDNQPENFPINDSTINRKIDQEIRFCISQDGVKLAYARVGNGPPLVKAANWLSHLEYEWQSPVWRHWIEGLSRHHTLIRYDERGCGLSDWNVGELSLEAWVSDLEAVVDAAGLERFPLLGISQGGAIAITYAVRHPEKVSHLILYGAYTRGKLRRNLSPAQEEEIMTLIQLIKVGWGKENPVFRQVYTSLFMPEGTPEQHAWFNELQRVSSTPETAARIVTGFGEIDVRQLATAVSAPTLILHATGDARVPFDEGRLAASLIPGARFVPLESKNHLLIETEPAWGQFLEEVEGFLIEDASNASEEKAIKPNMITNTV